MKLKRRSLLSGLLGLLVVPGLGSLFAKKEERRVGCTMTFNDDAVYLFADGGAVHLVPGDGGEPRLVIAAGSCTWSDKECVLNPPSIKRLEESTAYRYLRADKQARLERDHGL